MEKRRQRIILIVALLLVAALLVPIIVRISSAPKNAQGESGALGENAAAAVPEESAEGESGVAEDSSVAGESGAAASMEALNAQLRPAQLPDDRCRTSYEIFVYSFADSDGDGIGDLQGALKALDYVNDGDPETMDDLGCGRIWLMPVFPSPTYHKYDVTDYIDVDPQYGTMADLEAFLEACHARDVKVILDLPLNHTSTEHPWFRTAVEALRTADGNAESCPEISYYNFSNEKQAGYEPLEGTNLYYEARFWSGMPDLDLSNEAVREKIREIVRFWLDKGVDGFRLDAVTSFYTDDHAANVEFLAWLNDTVKEIRPDAYLVGEAWENQQIYARYYESGIDSLFDFAFAGADGRIAQIVKGARSAASFAQDMRDEEELYRSFSEQAVNAPFYTNHDMARSTGYYAYDDGSKTKLAGALNLLQTGSAFLYYGEELGMKGSGKDENKRAPMPWTDDTAAEAGKGLPQGINVCAGPPDMEPQAVKFGSVAQQDGDPNSILNYFRNAIRVRGAFPAIACGKTQPLEELSGEDVGAFLRTAEETGAEGTGAEGTATEGTGKAEELEPVLVIFSTSEEERQIDLSAADAARDFTNLAAMLTVSEEPVTFENGVITLPPRGIAILTKQSN